MPRPLDFVAAPSERRPDDPPVRQKTWDDLLQAASPAAVEAILFLRQVLGEGWAGLRTNAPLAMTMCVSFNGTPPVCVQLQRLLAPLVRTGDPNIAAVISHQLGRAGTAFLHGMTVLELAGEAQRRGLPFCVHPPGGAGTVADVEVCDILFEVTCAATRPLDDLWIGARFDAERYLRELDLSIGDFRFELVGEPPARPGFELSEAARLARFSPTYRVQIPGGSVVVYWPEVPQEMHWAVSPDRRTLASVALNAVKSKRPQLRGHVGPRLVVVRVDAVLKEFNLLENLEDLNQGLRARFRCTSDGRGWPEVSGCVVVADHLGRPAADQHGERRGYRFWTGTTGVGCPRLVAVFPNECAMYPLLPDQVELLVGPGHLFEQR